MNSRDAKPAKPIRVGNRVTLTVLPKVLGMSTRRASSVLQYITEGLDFQMSNRSKGDPTRCIQVLNGHHGKVHLMSRKNSAWGLSVP